MLSTGDEQHQQQEEKENHPRDLISSNLRPSNLFLLSFSFFLSHLETLPLDFFCSFIYFSFILGCK